MEIPFEEMSLEDVAELEGEYSATLGSTTGLLAASRAHPRRTTSPFRHFRSATAARKRKVQRSARMKRAMKKKR